MAYRFRLATLLQFRESLEHRCWLELQVANQKVQHVEGLLVQLERGRMQWRTERLKALGSGTIAAELDSWGAQYYEGETAKLTQLLLQAKVHAEVKLADFYRARQKRQVLENLSLRDRARYEAQRARREQARVDELFLMRHGRWINTA
jgi:flagellar export protein FliJ